MNPALDFAGHYTLHPGLAQSIEGHRPILANGILGRLVRDKPGESVVHMLGALFSLCSHAHRRTAGLALNAANPAPGAALPVAPALLLGLETARDHLRAMALDWPRYLPEAQPGPDALDWLTDCPLSLNHAALAGSEAQARESLTNLRHWLEHRLLGQSVSQWLAQHRDCDRLAQWCHANAQDLAPARSLHAWHARAHDLTPAMRALDLLDADPLKQADTLRTIAHAIGSDGSFARHPVWLGQCAETGPGTRLRNRNRANPATPSAWTRLAARWIELLEITAHAPDDCAPDTNALLVSGAMQVGAGQAIAWCEMARGLLLHWVQLDTRGRVADYRVLAPTEWNFHPQGALARALTRLAPQDTASAWALAAAFDACVQCRVRTDRALTENTHA